MTGAVALMVITRPDPHDILVEVEWTTLLFFVGLFIVVGGIEHVGLIETIADGLLGITGTDLVLTGLLILWLSAVASALVDNIPFTAAMIPLVQEVGNVIPVQPLWWALAMGADFGGNATIIGASANVVVASIAERNGYKITFVHFMKYGVIVTVMTLILSSAYLWLRYLTSA
jgi:Na+/H+ antiporter NhaD/arsenite permease-like protein